jgi:hypothetical protein
VSSGKRERSIAQARVREILKEKEKNNDYRDENKAVGSSTDHHHAAVQQQQLFCFIIIYNAYVLWPRPVGLDAALHPVSFLYVTAAYHRQHRNRVNKSSGGGGGVTVLLCIWVLAHVDRDGIRY